MTMRLAVFQEFSKKEVLEKVPKGVTVEFPEKPWRFEEDKRSEKEKHLLATNAKLIFDPKVNSLEDVEGVIKSLEGLGFEVVTRAPMTSTQFKMEDRVILEMK
eukprot:TRINITY_DN1111_c0_g2_i1.p1 TRINITY_DN1111_c0_g2~~TRINITY_DN1111_c0_g2_i1.p1  ORF type:complete len:103 (+),score=18.68 TRINITY_DN1111_c0_g2_i1:46-354(+)